ncbi:hypothetical protein GQ53DRAFT_56815 [Thozetella sp. PMI_491]|nr:hypothetical protein GQ53DRAFT_56815 [Thozetella sp. PMI_491]
MYYTSTSFSGPRELKRARHSAKAAVLLRQGPRGEPFRIGEISSELQSLSRSRAKSMYLKREVLIFAMGSLSQVLRGKLARQLRVPWKGRRQGHITCLCSREADIRGEFTC